MKKSYDPRPKPKPKPQSTMSSQAAMFTKKIGKKKK